MHIRNAYLLIIRAVLPLLLAITVGTIQRDRDAGGLDRQSRRSGLELEQTLAADDDEYDEDGEDADEPIIRSLDETDLQRLPYHVYVACGVGSPRWPPTACLQLCLLAPLAVFGALHDAACNKDAFCAAELRCQPARHAGSRGGSQPTLHAL